MKIKRFVAADMRSAFALVRQEQGPDAVILSNRVIDEGVEIVAASNYDEALVMHALEAARRPSAPPASSAPAPAMATPPPPAEPVARPPSPAEAAAAYFQRVAPATPPSPPAPAVPAEPTAAPVPPREPRGSSNNSFAAALAAQLPPLPESFVPVAQTAPRVEAETLAADVNAVPAEAAAESNHAGKPALRLVEAAEAREQDEQLVQMRGELAQMREMIEREMHRLTDERLRGSPVRAQALELMDDYGFDAGITRDIALQIPADTELHRGRGLMLGLLSKKLPILAEDPLERGGVIALVGPTGAGKTTTIAKLAATYASLNNPRDIALITTDTIRVGGREQLHSYGRQLGIAVHEADSEQRLADLLERLRDYKLILIDTAGLGQRDKNLVAQLGWLRNAGPIHTLLCLPANSHFADLDEVVRRFSSARPQGVVLTKLDETGRLGSALSVVVDHQLPMAWVTDGQRVPDDLHRANGARLVLRLDQLRREADEPCSIEASHVA